MCTAEKYFTGGFILILPSLRIAAPPGGWQRWSFSVRSFETGDNGSTDGLELDGDGASEAKKGDPGGPLLFHWVYFNPLNQT